MFKDKIIKNTYYCILYIFVIYLLYNYIYYYKERIANSDDFFPFYNIIEHNTIDMMHFRFLQGLYSNSFSLLYLDTLFRDSFLSIEI